MTADARRIREVLREQGWLLAGISLLYALLFWPVLRQWAVDCWSLEDFSHCLLVPPIAGIILYARRRSIAALEVSRGRSGLILLLASLGIFFYGHVLAINVFQRAGALGALVGTVILVLGLDLVKKHAFPFFFLLLAIPIPFVLYSRVAVGLRGVVTELAASLLQLGGIPAFNDGNILEVGDLRLGVVDACSGIRSLMAITTVAFLCAYLFRAGPLRGGLLVAMTIPVGIALNVLRVMAMAVSSHSFGVDLTAGVRHEVLGFATFALIMGLVYLSWLFIDWFAAGWQRRPAAPEAS